jgi:demethylspheroidene O-methyltransferase
MMAWLSALRERFDDYWNRRVADPAFRRWAGRFLLTRPVARRRANALFDLTAGFVYSQILSACVQIGLFDTLARGARSVDDIASGAGLPPEATSRLLKAAAALDLVSARSGQRYALGKLGAALVGNDGVTAMIRHHSILYEDLAEPLRLLRGEAHADLQRYWAYAGRSRRVPQAAQVHADYTELMAASQVFVAGEVLDAYDIRSHTRMLDVGGGNGTFAIAAARAAPALQLEVFDLPPVAAIARKRLLEAGISGRARATGGSFLDDPLPGGADLVVLNRVMHDHDDDAVRILLQAARKAVAHGGTLLVAEPMAGTRGARASGDAYFGFYLLAMGQGRPRTAAEIGRLMREAGFSDVRQRSTATPLIVRVMTARAA